MEIVRGLSTVDRRPDGVLTVGSFDGLHLGHQRILRRMRLSGRRPVTVLTFNPHPKTIVRPDLEPPPQLTTFEERIELFRSLKVDRLIIAKFDREFAALSPEDFTREVLWKRIGMTAIYIGPRHGFGAGRRGDAELLAEMGKRLGFELFIVPPVKRDGDFISSSRIRKLLATGDFHNGMRYLGRPFNLAGEVVRGDGRGMKLGFPTANLSCPENGKLTPPAGIYATVTEVDGVRYPSVSHLGDRPTFPGSAPSIETHLIGFEGDLLGKTVRLGLVERLRDVERFHKPAQLVERMILDREISVHRLAANGFGEAAREKVKRFGALGA